MTSKRNPTMRRKKKPRKITRKQVGALLDEDLYAAVRAQAIVEGRVVGKLIDDGMRLYLQKAGKPFRM